jgi:hypothetical protein
MVAIKFLYRFTFKNRLTGAIHKVIADNPALAELATPWPGADCVLIRAQAIDKIGPEKLKKGHRGRPRLQVNYAVLLRLADEGLGYKLGAERYTEATGDFISADTFKRRLMEQGA